MHCRLWADQPKHVLRAAHGLRHYVDTRVFSLQHVPGKDNVADIMTKAQAVAVFTHLFHTFLVLTHVAPGE